jgi:UDP-N-acetylglucosamine--N-acetylmuramyl-(pentapeptide) pyrophosphoryl-undecaprenol N-acetylglucosamine transferase
VLTEADSHLGLTNRLLAGRARRVCLAFPLAGREDPSKYVVTGRPVPWVGGPDSRAAARARFGLDEGDTMVLVFGGSLGARTINEAAVDAFRDAPFRVLHASGTRDFEALRERLGSPAPANYDLRAYITPFGPALAAADLTVARSGGSVFEIAAAGLPALLVPYPHAAADHQTTNAAWMADAGAAVVLRDEDVTPQRLDEEVGALLNDPARLAAMAEASRGLARPDAAQAIAREVLEAAASRG